jgi:DNA gyrase/topoisomerase IV, subunit A
METKIKYMRKAKDLIKPKHKEKIIRLPISKFIDTKFRDYAVYVLESRGIPSFYDALTPVQRFILKNSPTSYNKSLAVIGKCIQDGYHHGDSSLIGAVNKLARPFGNAMPILEGDGFFGSEAKPAPAAPRYTSVRLSSLTNNILNKYNYLTTREIEGPYDPLWMDIPLGLVSPIVGIAVGYKTTILPRKLKDIQEFLAGTRKSVKPYFEGFTGTVEKFKGADKSWIISSAVQIDGKKILIREIPPILKFDSVLKKLDHLFSRYEGLIRIEDNSKVKVNIDIIYTGKSGKDWDDIVKFVKKVFSIIVTETPVFVKDGQVLTYDSIEQYLEDYKWQIVRLKLHNTIYERDKIAFDLEFNEVKYEFIKFMVAKQRNEEEVVKWLKPYKKEIIERLERIPARKCTTEELLATAGLIAGGKRNLKDKEKELKEAQHAFDKYPDPTLARGIGHKTVAVNLFETADILEDKEGIAIWDGNDVFENDQETDDEEI